MENLAVLIGECINWIILVVAVFTFAGFIYVAYAVNGVQKKQNAKHDKRRVRRAKGGYAYEIDVHSWEENLDYLNEFNKIQVKYEMLSQIIPVFPLLGILGTVAGLIKQLGNVDQMKDALALSMSTTFWGLIAAIALKLVDTLWISRIINTMSLDFDLFDQNYQLSKDLEEEETEN